MKKLAGIILIFVCLNGLAQQAKNKLFYVNGGLSVGNFSGGQFGFNLAIENRYSLQLECSGVARKAEDSPLDYSGGLFSTFVFNINKPVDNIQTFRILAGKILTKNPSDKIRISLKAGISFSTYQEAYDFVEQAGLFLVPNYSWSTHTAQQVGVIIKPDFEILINWVTGLALTPYVEFNSQKTSAGLAISLLLGKLQTRKN